MAKKRTFDPTILIIPLVLLAVLVVVQILSYRFTARVDLTPRRVHSLAQISRNVIAQLDGSPLKATAFYAADDIYREQARDLFEEIRQAYRPFSYEFVDPTRNPRLVELYEVGSNGTVVLEYRGGRTKVVSREEQALINGLHRLVQERQPVVYFTTGHGEKTSSREYSSLAQALSAEQYQPRDLLLIREPKVPADAQLVVVAAPREDLSPHVIRLLQDYYDDGGSLLIMLDPLRNGGLTEFLEQTGVELYWDTIIDERSQVLGGDVLFPIVGDYGSNPITGSVDLFSFYPIARSIGIAANRPGGVDARPIARTGPDAWGERNVGQLSRGEPAFDPAEDLRGPLNIGVMVTRRLSQGGESRLVVFGDSDFAGNDYLEVSGNRDVIMNTVAWLTSEESLIGIRSRDPSHTPIVLTGRQSNHIFWLLIVLLPGLSAVAGLAVFLRMRWKH